MKHNIEWLIALLSKNRIIHMYDGLGTFIAKQNDKWKICGRDDITSLLDKRFFEIDDLSSALFAAKSIKKKFFCRTK